MNSNVPTDPIEAAKQSLRELYRVWATRAADALAYKRAKADLTALLGLAASIEASRAVDLRIRDLGEAMSLRGEARLVRLENIGKSMDELRPLFPQRSSPPIGTLPTAIDPGRAESRATAAPPRPNAPGVLSLDAPVTDLPRVGPAVATKLAKLGIVTVGDLLDHGPRVHIDASRSVRIAEILMHPPGEIVTLRGTVIEANLIRQGRPRFVIKLADASGWVRVTWFNQYLANQIHEGDELAIAGTPDTGFNTVAFTGPEWEFASGPKATGLSTGRLTPIYPLTAGITQKTLRQLTRLALDRTAGGIVDHLPPAVREQAQVVDLPTAYEHLHYPREQQELARAQDRLAFDELLNLQLGMVRRKQATKGAAGIPLEAPASVMTAFRHSLPFRLTGAQDGALEEILADMIQPHPMSRLVQGDVGSGKTAVAAAAMLVAHANGYQSAMMAPTQILAEQHDRGLRLLYAELPEKLRPEVVLLTGNTPVRERRRVLAALALGEADILVGTQALLEDPVELPRLGLTVMDEQHRFGVRQRANLATKTSGPQPHVLMLTATPIPRTLNMVAHGDIDVSVIGERPPGRMPIETRRYIGSQRREAYDLVREQVAQGRQAFVICPRVEASEASEAKAAVDEAKRLQEEVFPDLRVDVLHGRMSGKTKDAIMTSFRKHEFDILVATSVIEVGIDVPNATVMVIEGADSFGLAQLHQFRGRVGRGSAQSWCLLLADEGSPLAEERLAKMCETDDGFKLAELDLVQRGPGDFIGTRQSGLPEMPRVREHFTTKNVERARRVAEAVLKEDPGLERPEHRLLRARYETFWERSGSAVPV